MICVFTVYSLRVSVVHVEGDTCHGEGDSKNSEDSSDPEQGTVQCLNNTDGRVRI